MSLTQTILVEGLGLPQDAVDINRRAWFRDIDGNRAVFVDQTPFYCYPLDDPTLHRFCAVQLVEAGIAKVREVCSALEINPRTFSRWRTKFQRHGIAGLVAETVGRKQKKTPTLTAGIVQRYKQGKSTRDIATQGVLLFAVPHPGAIAAGFSTISGDGSSSSGTQTDAEKDSVA
jgi:hypothetical protein